MSLTACGNKDEDVAGPPEPPQAEISPDEMSATPQQLPVRFQQPGYFSEDIKTDTILDEKGETYEIKVGANISSTKGPQPLWDILKRLCNLKGMNVSWANDVDQMVLVDVNISAEDNFFDAIDNLLRQVDYYFEVDKDTIIVKYKETKQFHITMPYMKGTYTSNVGGNFLTDREAATGTEGTVKLKSTDNAWDHWDNIIQNLDTLLAAWQTTTITSSPAAASKDEGKSEKKSEGEATGTATRRYASHGSYYTIDKAVGLITVTAPRSLLEKVEFYINSLTKELYRQVMIEAKIVEVYLQDNSRIGLDWSNVLKNFNIGGSVEFGASGQIYPWIPTEGDAESPTRFVSKVSVDTANFSVLLNALDQQGDANVLSNPKITVMNGQPALINVGTDIAYIKSINSDLDTDTGLVTYTVETDSVVEGVALGVMASIVDDHSVMLHLTPITTELVEDPIEYQDIGTLGAKIGLPRVSVREASTMVQVNNGEMLIIGGLIDKVEKNNSDMAPIVGKIPLIKYLFGVEDKIYEKRELVILLTPKII